MQLQRGLIVIEVDILVFGGAPQPFDEDIIESTPATVHADQDLALAQRMGELRGGELATLIGDRC